MSMTPEAKASVKLALRFAKAARQIEKQGKGKDKDSVFKNNFLISPQSLLISIAMMAKASDHKTRKSVAKEIFDVDADDLDAAIYKLAISNAALSKTHERRSDVRFSQALWANTDKTSLDIEYKSDTSMYFDSEIRETPFDKSSAKPINQWAGNLARKRKDDFVAEGDVKPLFNTVLTSVYDHDIDWTHGFLMDDIVPAFFTQDNGDHKELPMLFGCYDGLDQIPGQYRYEGTGEVKIHQGNGYEAISLACGVQDPQDPGKEPELRIVFVKPDDNTVSAQDLLAADADRMMMTGDPPVWLDLGVYSSGIGVIDLPAFDLHEQGDLMPLMKASGLDKLFNSSADLGRGSQKKKPFSLSAFYHSAAVKNAPSKNRELVDDADREKKDGIIPLPFVDATFDRSFIMAVQDIKTGSLLCLAAINDPAPHIKPLVVGAPKPAA